MRSGFVKRGGIWIIVQSSLMMTVVAAGIFDRQRFEPFPFQFTLATTLFIVAAIVGVAGVISLGKSRTAFPEPRDGGELAEHGVYGIVRHPLYTSVILWGLSWCLFWRSGVAAGATLAMTVFFDAKARYEERLLMSRFGGYAAYKSRVRRFIPWVY